MYDFHLLKMYELIGISNITSNRDANILLLII